MIFSYRGRHEIHDDNVLSDHHSMLPMTEENFTVNCILSPHEISDSKERDGDDIRSAEYDRVLDDIAIGLTHIDSIAKEIRSELCVQTMKIDVMDKKVNYVLETELLLVNQMR